MGRSIVLTVMKKTFAHQKAPARKAGSKSLWAVVWLGEGDRAGLWAAISGGAA